MAAVPYPHDIKPLTSLRFIAAFWVLLYHFKDHLGLGLGRYGLIADGYLGVDLFFTLSGFILAHVYLAAVQAGRVRLWRLPEEPDRPGLSDAPGRAGGHAGAFRRRDSDWRGRWQSRSVQALSDLPAHLFMVHAWGTTAAVGWNFPSWSISAEWAAYLLFPIIAALVLKTKRGRLGARWRAGAVPRLASRR